MSVPVESRGFGGWYKYPGNPVLAPVCPLQPLCTPEQEQVWDSWDTEGPSVLRVGETYHMFYEGDRRETQAGRASTNIKNQIGHATSSDGINWVKDPRNPVFSGVPESEGDEVLSPAVLHYDGKFWMFYNSPPGETAQLYLAISVDGVTWERKGPVLNSSAGSWDQYGVSDAVVLHDGDQFLMWYTGDVIPLATTENRAIGFATSRDGLNWTKYEGNPVLARKQGNFDDLSVYDAAVILEGGVYRMWYTCVNKALFGSSSVTVTTALGWNICYAQSSDGKKWTKFGGNPVLSPGDALFERNEIGTPTVLKEGDVYRMWYTGGVSLWSDMFPQEIGAQGGGLGYAAWRAGTGQGPKAKQVKVRDSGFSPRTLRVLKGGSVVWVWKGRKPHNVAFRKVPISGNKGGSQTMRKGRFTRSFNKRGIYSYIDTSSGLRGWVVVG